MDLVSTDEPKTKKEENTFYIALCVSHRVIRLYAQDKFTSNFISHIYL